MPHDPHDPSDKSGEHHGHGHGPTEGEPEPHAVGHDHAHGMRDALKQPRGWHHFHLGPKPLARAQAQLAAQGAVPAPALARAVAREKAIHAPLVDRHPEGLCSPSCDGHFPDLLDLALALCC